MRYVIKRSMLAVATLLVLSLILFSTMTLVPLGARIRLYRSEFLYKHPGHQITDEQIIAKYHLDDPFILQWAQWFEKALKGDLGDSKVMGYTPAMKGILHSFGATAEIVLYSAPISVCIGYKLGVLSARRAHKRIRRGDAVDGMIRVATTIGYSTPAFLLGLSLLQVFYLGLHWPSIGRLGYEADFFVSSSEFTAYTGLHTIDSLLNGKLWILYDALRHLALPVLTLTITVSPIITRITRASMIEELSKPYILSMRAKGLSEKEVVNHAKKPSAFSVFTVSGILVATMLTGVVVVEYIFNIQGVGYWLVRAATRWDYTLLVDISLLFCIIFVTANLVIDVLYTYLDPRVKL